MGRMSTPGWSAGTRINDSPRCFGASGSVRHSTYSQSARVPNVIQIFCPFSTHSSPSRTARVRTPPRSEPASGSLKPCPHMSSQRMMRGRKRAFCSSLPGVQQRGAEEVAPVHADPVRRAGPEVLLQEHELLLQRAPASSVFDRPRDAEPAALGELALPRQAQFPPRVVGGAADTWMARELPGQVLGQPVPDLLAARGLDRGVGEVHQVSVRWCGARGLPLYVRSEPVAIS